MKKLVMILALFLIAIISVSAQPTLPTISDVSVNEGATATIEITLAAGPDNGSTTWATNFSSLIKTQSNSTYAKYIWSTGFNDAGVYNVKFNASDANSSDTKTMKITVVNVNRNPVITSTPVTTATVGHAYTYTVSATDADGDTIQYSLGTIKPSGMTINSATGVVAWTPTAASVVPVTVQASDGTNTTAQNFNITVSEPSRSMSLSTATLGGSSQNREENTTTTMTLTNTGTETITGISLNSSISSTYQIVMTPTTIASLAPSASTTVTVQGYIPDDKDAVKQSIGTITATGTSGGNQVTASGTLSMQAENNLIIKKVRVKVNGDSTSLDDNEDVDVYPAADIEMEIEVKNRDRTYDLEDVTVSAYNGDDINVDEEDTISRIRHGKTDTTTFKFTIDKDASGGNYDVDVIVEGDDENGAVHGETWTIRFRLDEDGIIIRRADFVPAVLACDAKSVDLKLQLENVGTSDESNAAVEVVSTSLNYEKRTSGLNINEDDTITRTYTVPLNKVSSGQYFFELKAFKDFDTETNRRFVYLSVPPACSSNNGGTTTPPTTPTTPPIVINPPTNNNSNTGQFVDVSTGETSGFASSLGGWGTVLLVLANILILVIIIILVVKFLL